MQRMSEFCLPNARKPEADQRQLSAILISDFFLLCSLLLSHPLYFAYFIFFSPYLLKLLSFLSPLFLTTALLLLTGALLLHGGAAAGKDELSDPKSPLAASFLRAAATVRSVLEKLRFRAEEEQLHEYLQVRTVVEELEVYRIVFEVAEIPVREPSIAHGGSPDALAGDSDEKPVEAEQTAEEFVQEKEIWCETVSYYAVEEENALDLVSDSTELGKGQGGEEKKPPLMKSGSVPEATGDPHLPKLRKVAPEGENPSTNLGSFGSMRKEKEWKRTLACKLFEERHSGHGYGEEGMDSLWETHEAESDKLQAKSRSKKGTKTKNKKCYADEEEDQEADDEERGPAQLCCLQALKFSAGKMNLGMGMGRPGLVKISKALKGMGWFHHGGRHGKKGSYH